jgi:hypothetical protein
MSYMKWEVYGSLIIRSGPLWSTHEKAGPHTVDHSL